MSFGNQQGQTSAFKASSGADSNNFQTASSEIAATAARHSLILERQTFLSGAEITRPHTREGIEVSYENIKTHGVNYDPVTRQTDVLVATDPNQVRRMDFLIFENENSTVPSHVFPMEDTGEGKFCISLKGKNTGPGMLYALAPAPHTHNPDYHWVIDPDAKSIVSPKWNKKDGHCCPAPDKNDFTPPKARVLDLHNLPPVSPAPHINPAERVFYEFEIKSTAGFPDDTIDPEFRGMQGTVEFMRCPQLIEHLKSLGITTLQIMPMQHHMNEWMLHLMNEDNQWRYNPINLFAFAPDLFHNPDPMLHVAEFRKTIDILHKNGFEVILDYVAGHTAESGNPAGLSSRTEAKQPDPAAEPNSSQGTSGSEQNSFGPTLSLRALANKSFYNVDNDGRDRDATACGHTFNINSELGAALIERSLDYLFNVIEVDGGRFDQAAILGLDEDLTFHAENRFLNKVIYSQEKLIALEPCDGRGLYQGEFAGENVIEHTFEDRNSSREFFAGQDKYPHSNINIVPKMAARISGNSDIYNRSHLYRPKNRGIRAADCHDGLTTWDATAEVLTQLKTNLSKLLEQGRMSPEQIAHIFDPQQEDRARVALAMAIHASVIFSPGPYMISRGAEFLKTQNGNPNAYNRPEFVPLEWDLSKAADKEMKIAFYQFMSSASSMRRELEVFHTVEHYRPHSGEIRWIDASGGQIGMHGKRRAEDQGREWHRQQNFIGALYSGIRFGEKLNRPAPVYVARAGLPGDITLPKLKEGWSWKQRLLTSDISNPTGQKILPSRATVHFDYPGVAVFELVRTPA